MITYCSGNLLDSTAQTLVNTVNCVGVMGRGIALEFKRRYPEMYRDYARQCERGLVRPGEPYLYTSSGTSIVNFPTKAHWKANSRIADIEHGLATFVRHYRDWKIVSIAFPPLGCGNGGLDWTDVRPLMERYLENLDAAVFVYPPLGSPEYPLATDEARDPNSQQAFVFLGNK